jgi:hypothetical protein
LLFLQSYKKRAVDLPGMKIIPTFAPLKKGGVLA